jgi:predicted negative regulator of RcsB-dependent stress response
VLSTIAVVIFIIVSMAGVVAWRGWQMRQLATQGGESQASIIRKVRFRGKSGVPSYRIRYAFTSSDGKSCEGNIALTETEAEVYGEGSTIAITYLPSNPRNSATAATVALAKLALQKK